MIPSKYSTNTPLTSPLQGGTRGVAVEDSQDIGYKNIAAMIAEFGRSDMLATLDSFKSLMVWYACEKLARQLTES